MSTNTSMTYGTLPTWDEFEAAFDRECPRGTYNIRLAGDDSDSVEGFKLGDGDWTSAQLWSAINEVVMSDGDMITVSEDDEYENVYQVLYPGTDRPVVEIGPEVGELIVWANSFRRKGWHTEIKQEHEAIEALNYASAYGTPGTDWTRYEQRMDLVSSIMETLGFEWV